MSNHYKLNVNNTFQYDVENDVISQLDAVSVEKNKFHILKNNTPYQAEIIATDFINKTYTVKVNNSTYTVAIANTLDMLIKEMGFEVGAAKQVNAIKAPMPGLILKVNVSEGQKVKEGDILVILEAMKMENTLTSPNEGIIKSISVEKGKTVEKGEVLIELN